jgi:hypothetical protein
LDVAFQYLLLSIFLAALALPFYLRWVPPNYFLGFKEERLLKNRSAWYTINKFYGVQILKGSLFLALLSLVLPFISFQFMYNEVFILLILVIIALFVVITTKRYFESYFNELSSAKSSENDDES